MKNKNNTLDVGLALKAGGVITVIIFVGIMLFSYINSYRNKKIVEEYTQETKKYIQKNQQGLEHIFTSSFQEAKKCELTYSTNYASRESCKKSVSEDLYKYVSNDLKDFSSTGFMKFDKTFPEIMLLSGQYSVESNETPRSNSVNKMRMDNLKSLFEGKVNSIPWDNYTDEFSGKEVVIPVTKDSKVIGAIVRRVIE